MPMSPQPAGEARVASDWGDEWSSEADVRRIPSRQRAAPAPQAAAASVDELTRALAEFEPEFESEVAKPLVPRIVHPAPEALIPVRVDPRRSLARWLATTVAAAVLLIALAGLAPLPPPRVPRGIAMPPRVPHDVALPAVPMTELVPTSLPEGADARLDVDTAVDATPGSAPRGSRAASALAPGPVDGGSRAAPARAAPPPVVATVTIGQRGAQPPGPGLVLSTSTGEERTGTASETALSRGLPPALLSPATEAAPAASRPAVASSASAPPVPSARQIIYGVLAEYQGALNRLDVTAVRAIWPSLDAASLERAFTQLERQSVLFDACSVAIIGDGATARCQGTSSYVPRVGRRTERLGPRHWRIELKQAETTWHIVAVDARE